MGANAKIMFVRIACLDLLVLLSLGIRAAYADDCLISGPRYQLHSDSVEWQMTISSGHNCVRGVRFGNVANTTINLISPPQFGQLVLLSSGFSYTAKTDFEGDDYFVVGVSGAINRVSGTSTVRILVSIVGAPQALSLAAPASRHDPSAPAAAPGPKAPSAPSVDNTMPLPVGASLPTCPTWEWSSGAPPLMRPPFDRSKLYCPPPPFNPPGPPFGCICPQ